MPRLLHSLLLAFAACTCIAGAATLEELQQAFLKRYDEINTARDTKLAQLESSYSAALQRQIDRAGASGDLESVLPFRNEKQALESGKTPPPDLPPGSPRELSDMRATYLSTRQSILSGRLDSLRDLADKMSKTLEIQEAELTRAGNIEMALAARKMRTELPAQLGLDKEEPEPDEPSGDLPPGDLPPKDAAGFMDLLKFPYRIEYSTVYTGPATGQGGEGKLTEVVGTWHKQGHKNPDEILVLGPRSSVEFTLPERVSEFRGTARVLPAGDVIFRVLVRGKVVLEQQLGGATPGPKELECRFSPTRRIALQLDPNGDPGSDCASWIQPRVG